MEEDKRMSLKEQEEFLEMVLETSAETLSSERREQMKTQLEGIALSFRPRYPLRRMTRRVSSNEGISYVQSGR